MGGDGGRLRGNSVGPVKAMQPITALSTPTEQGYRGLESSFRAWLVRLVGRIQCQGRAARADATDHAPLKSRGR